MANYIYGAGGHGKVVLDAMLLSGMECAGFVDIKDATIWAGLEVFRSHPSILHNSVHIAIGDCKLREKLAIELEAFDFLNVIHPNSQISKMSKIGHGVFLAANSVIAPDVIVGNHSIVNHGAVVDHDCTVGNYCHIAPNSTLCGGVTLGVGVMIGAGAVVLPGLTIENYAVIGAGAVVTKNVISNTTVIGNPAKSCK